VKKDEGEERLQILVRERGKGEGLLNSEQKRKKKGGGFHLREEEEKKERSNTSGEGKELSINKKRVDSFWGKGKKNPR